MIEIGYLKQILKYDRRKGVVFWRRRNPSMFKNGKKRSAEVECRRWNNRYAGSVAGTTDSKGYLQIKICGKALKLHRVIWAIEYGEWPRDNIDHKNGKRSDNKKQNLRDATFTENAQNLSRKRRNSSGLLGVAKNGRFWQSQITVNGKYYYLGLFRSKKKAHARYLTAKSKLHAFQPVPRSR